MLPTNLRGEEVCTTVPTYIVQGLKGAGNAWDGLKPTSAFSRAHGITGATQPTVTRIVESIISKNAAIMRPTTRSTRAKPLRVWLLLVVAASIE